MLGGNLIIISFQAQLPATGVIAETHCVPTARGYPTTGHAGTPRDRLTGRLGN